MPLTSILKTITSCPADIKRTPKAPGNSNFLTPEAKLAFLQLRQAFIKVSILYHFDLKRYIWNKTDVSDYAINDILSQIMLESDQWHSIAFFSRKMIPAKTWYKTHNQELLAIIKAFKTWCHYMEGCKFEVLVLTNHNNLYQSIDTKRLSFIQVRWA